MRPFVATEGFPKAGRGKRSEHDTEKTALGGFTFHSSLGTNRRGRKWKHEKVVLKYLHPLCEGGKGGRGNKSARSEVKENKRRKGQEVGMQKLGK